jgi:hypothetical protein
MFTKPSSSISDPFFLRAKLLAGALAAAVLAGCSMMAPRTEFRAPFVPAVYKRVALHEERDLVHRWRAKAFSTLKPDPASVSAAQEKVLKKHGFPDYTRTFRSRAGERVVEWVYLKPSRLFQFVKGQRAYSGPATDMERVLIRHGYPNEAARVTEAQGPERLEFIYWNWCHTSLRTYSFSNGKLAAQRE